MISCTLNQYKESFKTNLLVFLNEYEDNTKTFFLQNEKTKYQAYQNALTKIVDQMKLFTREELNQNMVHRSIASDLKSIDLNIYNSIITELNPVQDETILSLSAAKKDRIKINELELENHIKSSIVILKFISVESEEALNTKSTDLDNFTVDNELEQIVTDLWNWHKDYEAKHKYISISGIFEEKADYVTDNYKNYEERYLKYQLENCNVFLEEVPNDEVLIDCKKKLENKLIELRQQIPLPSKNIDILINDINNAFYRLEQFMKGKILDYKSFLFNDAFTLLINELNKLENVNIKYDSIGNTYWYLMNQLDYAYDKSEFENQDAYKNEDFNRDSNEISYIQWNRMQELNGKSDLEDYQFKLPSILDIVTDAKDQAKKTVVENSNQVENSSLKTIELTIENLFSVGLTPEIIKNNFEDWVLENRDIKIDFDNNLIYFGIAKIRKNLETSMSLLRKNFQHEGMSEEEVINHFAAVKSRLGDKLNKTMDYFDEDQKLEFLLKTIKKMSGQVSEIKDVLIENEIEQLFNFEDIDSEKTTEQHSDLSNPVQANPYPRIFTSHKAYKKFINLLEKFGETPNDLANYSFVYHRMVKDKYIYDDYKQKEFVYFLLEFNINIDRIKPKTQLGNNDLRESIYNSLK